MRVKPGARRNQVVAAYNGALKVEVSKPPEKGKANAAVSKLLAAFFDVTPSSVTVVAGASSQDKTILVSDLTPKQALYCLQKVGIAGVIDQC